MLLARAEGLGGVDESGRHQKAVLARDRPGLLQRQELRADVQEAALRRRELIGEDPRLAHLLIRQSLRTCDELHAGLHHLIGARSLDRPDGEILDLAEADARDRESAKAAHGVRQAADSFLNGARLTNQPAERAPHVVGGGLGRLARPDEPAVFIPQASERVAIFARSATGAGGHLARRIHACACGSGGAPGLRRALAKAGKISSGALDFAR